MKEKILITLIICFTIFIVSSIGIKSWQYVQAQRTMFRYGIGHCEMGKNLIIICKKN